MATVRGASEQGGRPRGPGRAAKSAAAAGLDALRRQLYAPAPGPTDAEAVAGLMLDAKTTDQLTCALAAWRAAGACGPFVPPVPLPPALADALAAALGAPAGPWAAPPPGPEAWARGATGHRMPTAGERLAAGGLARSGQSAGARVAAARRAAWRDG